MTDADDFRRCPDPKRRSLPLEAQRHVDDARAALGPRQPRRHSFGVLPPVTDSPESRALARELTADYEARVAARLAAQPIEPEAPRD